MNSQASYILVSHIPKTYHACHLRNFFSQYVESSTFACFHFRHRPQVIIDKWDSVSVSALVSAINSRLRDKSHHCALLSIFPESFERFFQQYNRTHWLDTDDDSPLAEQCILTPIEISQNSDQMGMFLVGSAFRIFSKAALLRLIEFKPPAEMPQGNVGTPSSFFFTQIQLCRLDPKIITKLRLTFSGCGIRRKYGAVPYEYESQDPSVTFDAGGMQITSGDIRSSSGVPILDDTGYAEYVESRISPLEGSPIQPTMEEEAEVVDAPEDDIPQPEEDEPCEEWERFEALHDDPYKVTRSDKANQKYEDKVELVWEKGSSGLVFHTDERTWRKLDPLRKEEIFDEPASFDWDIDMEPYEQPSVLPIGPTPTGNWGSARDSSDLIDIQRSRENIDLPGPSGGAHETFHQQTYAKGYGQRLMHRMGWKPGSRLGPVPSTRDSSRRRGLLCPIEVDEHSLGPKRRTGLGYYGPPAVGDYSITPGQMANPVYIRTVFDSPETVARRSGLGLSKSLLRRDDPQLVLKYREPSEGSSKPDVSSSVSDRLKFAPLSRTVILNPHSSLSKVGITFVSGGLLHPSAKKSAVH